uniref:Uncharacterized protein n=1 Tax=Sphaerodactylus townsendi TaxID=933632 RepID=A0ACB8G3Y2_9SAUR
MESSFYTAAPQGSPDGSSPFRAFPGGGGGGDKFSSAFLTAKGQSGFGDGRSGSRSPKCQSRYSQGECPALEAGGGQGAPAAASFSKYHPQPQQQQQQQPPPLYVQRGPCKSPPGGSLKQLQDPSGHNGALQLSCYGERVLASQGFLVPRRGGGGWTWPGSGDGKPGGHHSKDQQTTGVSPPQTQIVDGQRFSAAISEQRAVLV